MGQRPRNAVLGIGLLLGMWIVAASISLARLLMTRQNSLTEVLWAEDGLFPLCSRVTGPLECLMDPFAGYLLGVPRLVAAVVGLAPLESWPLAANIAAAALWGLSAPLLWVFLRELRVGMWMSVLLALSPVLVPIVGFESANSVASIYMPLLFTATVAFLSIGSRSSTIWLAGLLGFLAATTIPLAFVLLIIISVRRMLRQVDWRTLGTVSVPTVAGLAIQAWVVFTAVPRRQVAIGSDAVSEWLNHVVNTTLLLWPGLTFGDSTVFGIFPLPVFRPTGLLVVVILIAVAALAIRRRTPKATACALLIASGITYSFIPAVTGYSSNRYFIPTTLCLLAAAMIAVDAWLVNRGLGRWSIAVGLACIIVWSPALPASDWRATASPSWSQQIAAMREQCVRDPWSSWTFAFSPDWPQAGVTILYAPTDNVVSCPLLVDAA